MGYCQDFDHDIFISYAHADNWDGWVTDLHDALKGRLLEDMYVEPRIWRDVAGGLDGKTIDGGISIALENSAVLLAVASGAFLNSTYCVPVEVTGFKHPHFPPVIRELSRIVTVVYKIPEEAPIASWPDLLSGVQAVRFDSPAGPHLKPPRRDPATLYWQAMEDLAHKIMAVLRELKKGLSGAEVASMSPPPAPVTSPVRRTAYQAVWKPNIHVTYDRKDKSRADQLTTDLSSQCEMVTVLPHDSAKERRGRYLQNADGHILMFGSSDIEWAEALAPESLAISAGQGRPKRIGLLTDCPDEFAIRNPLITPVELGGDGLKSFVSGLRGAA